MPPVEGIKAFTILSKINTTMDLKADYNQTNPVVITANVLDGDKNRLSQGSVTFTVEGKDYVVDVVDGVASLSHNFREGQSTVTATFFAENYNPARESLSVNVKKLSVDVNLDIFAYKHKRNDCRGGAGCDRAVYKREKCKDAYCRRKRKKSPDYS